MNNSTKSIVLFALLLCAAIASTQAQQDINFSSEYNKVTWPVALGLSGGITGDDGSYKRLALYHGGSISLQTGSNSPGISNSRLFINATGQVGIGTTSPEAKLDVNGNISVAHFGRVSSYRSANNNWTNLFLGGGIADQGDGTFNVLGDGANNYFEGIKMDFGGGSSIKFYSGTSTGGASYTLTNSDLENYARMTIVNGNVGIGTSSPDGLQVNKVLNSETSQGLSNIRMGVMGNAARLIFDTQGSTPFQIDNAGGQLRIFNPGVVRMVVNTNGYVGIGTSNPDALLTVSGQVHAQEVKVTVNAPGPDYVFEKDYQLTSLEEIKNYIDQNKHLPEVPSAKEMEKNGVQLGEMNMLLLKKIEELTLFVIKQNEKSQVQEEEIKTLKSEIELIKRK